MFRPVVSVLKWLARKAGYEVLNLRRPGPTDFFPPDFDQDAIQTYLRVRPYTMTSPERMYALVRSIEHIVTHNILGGIAECGVWRGGSMMAAALTLLRLGRSDRDVYLFDTFKGMTQPTAADGAGAQSEWASQERPSHNDWAFAGLDEVRANMASTCYPPERVHYIQGKVEDTIPSAAPERLALLRLDTDFYESTRHELLHMFDRLSPGGILIIDDYGCFPGSRQAVDEYFQANGRCCFLHRIDADARLVIKL